MAREDSAVVYLMKYENITPGEEDTIYKIGVAETTRLGGRIKELQFSLNQSRLFSGYRVELIDHVIHSNKAEAEKSEYLFHGYSENHIWLYDPKASRQLDGYSEMFVKEILPKWRHYRETGQIDPVGIESEKLVRFCFRNDCVRWPEAEPEILKDKEWARRYAFSVIDGEWPELEDILLNDSLSTWYKSGSPHQSYLENVRKERWLEFESKVPAWITGDIEGKKPRNTRFVARYCSKFRDDRWEEIEDWLVEGNDIEYAAIYWNKVGGKRWPELEEKLLSGMQRPRLYREGKKWPPPYTIIADGYREQYRASTLASKKERVERLLSLSTEYAEKFCEGDWPEIEKFAITDS